MIKKSLGALAFATVMLGGFSAPARAQAPPLCVSNGIPVPCSQIAPAATPGALSPPFIMPGPPVLNRWRVSCHCFASPQ